MGSEADKLRDFINKRKQAYHAVFDTPAGKIVLADLERFCRGTASTFHPDPRMAANLDGRREVFLRLSEHLNLTQEQLFELKINGE
jgi:hypothetical protein